MKNTAIFVILCLAIFAVLYLQLEQPSRTAIIEGCFSEELRGLDYQYAYLSTTDDTGIERRLDSCLVRGNRFTLSTDAVPDELTARISFARSSFTHDLKLLPDRTFAVTIRPESDLWQEAIEAAIARLDSAGYLLPENPIESSDSLRNNQLDNQSLPAEESR